MYYIILYYILHITTTFHSMFQTSTRAIFHNHLRCFGPFSARTYHFHDYSTCLIDLVYYIISYYIILYYVSHITTTSHSMFQTTILKRTARVAKKSSILHVSGNFWTLDRASRKKKLRTRASLQKVYRRK